MTIPGKAANVTMHAKQEEEQSVDISKWNVVTGAQDSLDIHVKEKNLDNWIAHIQNLLIKGLLQK